MRSLLAVLAVLSFCSTASLQAAPAADEAAIKDRLDAFQSAWNKDDTGAMAAMFSEDGTLITPVGVWARGPAEIAKATGQEHATVFKASKYAISDVKVQWLTPDVAIADVSAN